MADQGRICPHPIGYTLTALATAEKKAVLQLVLWIQYGVERSSVVDPIVKESGGERSSVADPIVKEMEQKGAVLWIRIRIQHFKLVRIQGFDRQKLKKYS